MATAKKAASKKPMTKSEIVNALAERSELCRKQVASVIDELGGLIEQNLGKRGPGVFSLAGLAKIKVIRKPATPARKGINPSMGEETTFKAKLARNVVKVQPLKKLEEMV